MKPLVWSWVVCSWLLLGCGSTPAPTPAGPVGTPGAHVVASDGTLVFHYAPDEPLDRYADGDRGAYVVAVRGGATAERIAALGAIGVTGGAHLEGERYVYRLEADQRGHLAALEFATIVGPLAPEQRYDTSRAPTAAVVIELFPDTSPPVVQAVADLLASWGATVEISAPTTLRATITPALLPAITRISPVLWLESR